MIRKSLALTAPSGTGWGAGIGLGVDSGQPSAAAMASASGSNGASVSEVMGSSLPADDEAVHRAIRGLFDQLVAGRAAPRRDVLDGARIRREQLDGGPGRQALDGLSGLDDGHRARQAARIHRLGDLDDRHDRLLPWWVR